MHNFFALFKKIESLVTLEDALTEEKAEERHSLDTVLLNRSGLFFAFCSLRKYFLKHILLPSATGEAKR